MPRCARKISIIRTSLHIINNIFLNYKFLKNKIEILKY